MTCCVDSERSGDNIFTWVVELLGFDPDLPLSASVPPSSVPGSYQRPHKQGHEEARHQLAPNGDPISGIVPLGTAILPYRLSEILTFRSWWWWTYYRWWIDV